MMLYRVTIKVRYSDSLVFDFLSSEEAIRFMVNAQTKFNGDKADGNMENVTLTVHEREDIL